MGSVIPQYRSTADPALLTWSAAAPAGDATMRTAGGNFGGNACGNSGGQSECYIAHLYSFTETAIPGRWLYIAKSDAGFGQSGRGTQFGTLGGSWSPQIDLGGSGGLTGCCGESSATAFLDRAGNVYYLRTVSHGENTYFQRSTDNGQSWGPRVNAYDADQPVFTASSPVGVFAPSTSHGEYVFWASPVGPDFSARRIPLWTAPASYAASGTQRLFGNNGGDLPDLTDAGACCAWALGDFSSAALSPDPVNLATGSFTAHATDLSLPGRTLPVAFSRWYNSADTTIGPLGPAWTHSYNWTLTDAGTSVTVRRGTGRRDTYARNADGSYALPADTFDGLVKNADASFTFTLTSQVQYEFSSAGQLSRIHEPAGNQIQLAYTGGNLTTITDAVGRQITLTYDGSNHLTQLQDPLGRRITYAYDAAGRLSTITDKLGNSTGQTPTQHQWRYGYDGSTQHVTTVTDPDGRLRVTNTYDNQGRVVQQRDGPNALTTMAYSTGLTVLTDPRNHATTYTFDSRMRVLSQSDVVGGTTLAVSYTYDAVGNRTSVTDRNGKRTDFSYDGRGNLLTKTDPQIDTATPRFVTQFAYDGRNNPTLITDPAGFTTTMTYDTSTNVLLSVARAIDATTTATTKYEYGDSANPGVPTRVIAPRGNTTGTPDYTFAASLAYDAQGNLVTQIDPDGARTTFVSDAVGRPTSSVDPDGNATGGVPTEQTWTTTYDANDRVLSATDPLTHSLQSAYDATGDRTSMTDRNGNVTTYSYDANTHLVAVTQKPDPVNQPTLVYTTQVTRDADGNSTRITQANGAATDYAFDALNRLTSVSTHPDASTTLTTSYVLDGKGNPLTRTTADGVAVSYSYDALSRLKSVAATGLATISYTYDPDGRRTQMIDGTGTTTYQYDRLGRPTQVAAPNGTLTYAWDRDGNRAALGYPGGQAVTSSYSPGGRLSGTTDWATRSTSFAYRPSGLIATVTYPNHLIATYGFDRAQRLSSLTNSWFSFVKNQGTYTLDAQGNRTALDEYVRGITAEGATDHFSYQYDGLNRLTAVGGATTESFSYDAGSNLTARTGPAATYTSDASNRLTSDGTKPYTWTAADRLATKGSETFTFDPLGRLTALTTHDDATLHGGATWSATDRPQGAAASLVLDGSTGYAEVPDSPSLNLTGDWTVEAWFKDESPTGYNHPFAEIVGKHDHDTSDEAPYFIEVIGNTIRAGTRSGGGYSYIDADLVTLGISANAWHHVAATLEASTRMLRLYLDGFEVAHGTIGALSSGSSVPLDIGRGGIAGKYWQGKIHDVRIWSLVRSAAQIGGAYQTELTGAQTGLVGNWKLDDGTGTVALDSATVTRTYAYNGDGLLQGETGSSTTSLLWDPATSPAKLLVMNTDRVVYAGVPLYVAHPNGTTTTLALDGLGSVRAEIADNGPLLKSFRYAAYGALASAPSGGPSLLGYTGELSDASGLVYLRARWYDPGIGRFVTSDPLGGTARVPATLAGYAYGGANPINATDPSGACSEPPGTGIRWCIEAFIPQETFPNLFGRGFAGDNRGPSADSGEHYRYGQFIWRDETGALRLQNRLGQSRLGSFARTAEEGLCDGRYSGSLIYATCSASDGLLVGFATWHGYYLRIRDTGSGARVEFAFGSSFPSLEVWEYGNGDPRRIFYHSAGGEGILGSSWSTLANENK